MNPAYHWLTITAEEHRFLKPVFAALGARTLRVWMESSVPADGFGRTACEGLVTALGTHHGRPVAIAWSDFRVQAACYTHANSLRFSAFLHAVREGEEPGIPLVYVVNSAGLSLMEGRRLFSDAFRLWPDLLDFADDHLLLTCAVGKCLGLAPLLFGLGHYRVAVGAQTQINLAGPEVFALFFGQGVDFATRAAAEQFHERNDLVHEVAPTLESALARLLALAGEGPVPVAAVAGALGARTEAVLSSVLDEAPVELIPGWCPCVRVFLGTRRGRRVGLFVNPPERLDNLITVRTLEKYAAGLDLFRALRLPIVSFLDSPGIDPRFEQSDANNIRWILRVGERIIRYPYGAMGVAIGRCYGGAASLGFPKVFGGRRVVALRGSTFGTMRGTIIDRLLQGSPRLREQWRATAVRQGPGLEDLLEEGTLDAVIEPRDLPGELDRFLAAAAPASTQRAHRPWLRLEPDAGREPALDRAAPFLARALVGLP